VDKRQSPLFSYIFAASTQLATASVVSGAVGLAAVPVTVHALGFSGYGVIGWYSAFLAGLSLFDGGTAKYLKRAVIRAESTAVDEVPSILSAYLWIVLALVVIAATGVLLIATDTFSAKRVVPLDTPLLAALAAVAVIEFTLGIPILVGQAQFLAADRYRDASALSAIGSVTRVISISVAALLWGDPVCALAVALCRRVVEAAYLWSRVGGWWLPNFAPIRPSHALQIVRQSASLGAVQLLQASASPVAMMVAQSTAGLESVGLLRATMDIVGRLSLIPNAIGISVFSRFAQFGRGDERVAEREILRLTSLTVTVVSLLTSLAGVILAVASSSTVKVGLSALAVGTISVVAAGGATLLCEGLIATERAHASVLGSSFSNVVLVGLALTLPAASGLDVLKWWAASNLVAVMSTATLTSWPKVSRQCRISGQFLMPIACAGVGITTSGTILSTRTGVLSDQIIPCAAVVLLLAVMWLTEHHISARLERESH
jgi:hypothetical protein